MSSFKAYRYELRAPPALSARLRRFSGMCRWVWNAALAEQRARYARGDRYASYVDMAKWLTAWRNAAETSWLAEGPTHPQQQVLRRLDRAYQRFFDACKAGHGAGRGGVAGPRFKMRGQEAGICFPDPKQFTLDAANGRIRLPKLGWVRLRMSRPPDGVLCNANVTREGSGKHERWFVSLQVRTYETVPALATAPTLGIDLGLTVFAATSDGAMVEPLKALAKQQRRLKRYQRSVARKKKGSANRKKAAQRLGDLHRRIARQRSDWLHKLSTELAKSHAVIALEDLRIKNMTASAAGTVEMRARTFAPKLGSIAISSTRRGESSPDSSPTSSSGAVAASSW